MLLGLEWYLWLIIILAILLCIPLKIKIIKWWNTKQLNRTSGTKNKWGDEND